MNNYENDQLYEDLIDLVNNVKIADNWRKFIDLRKGIKIIEARYGTTLGADEIDFINSELDPSPIGEEE